jgi:hypothetical protein
MSAQLITTGIYQVTTAAQADGRWLVSFRSTNAGLCHQLYVNGRLARWTADAAQRSFLMAAPANAVQVVVAAVSPEDRAADLSAELPADQRRPGWIFRTHITRSAAMRRGDVLEVLSDHATGGELSPTPLLRAAAWPAGLIHPDEGGAHPGCGRGAFGAGPFGYDADLIELSCPLAESGTHRIVIRTRARDGQSSDSAPIYFPAAPPARPPKSPSAISYDPQAHTLTLQINEGN